MPLKAEYRAETIELIKKLALNQDVDKKLIYTAFDRCVVEEPNIFFDKEIFGEFQDTPAYELIVKNIVESITASSTRTRSEFFKSLQKNNALVLYDLLFREFEDNSAWKSLQIHARRHFKIYEPEVIVAFEQKETNPVLLAINFEKEDLLHFFYESASIEPLAIYWRQAVSKNNLPIKEYYNQEAKKLNKIAEKKFNDVYAACKKAANKDPDGIRKIAACLREHPDILSEYFEKLESIQDYAYGDFWYKKSYTVYYRSVVFAAIQNVLMQNDKQLIEGFFRYVRDNYREYAYVILSCCIFDFKQAPTASLVAWDFIKSDFVWYMNNSDVRRRKSIINKILNEIPRQVDGVEHSAENVSLLTNLYKYIAKDPEEYLEGRVDDRYNYGYLITASSIEHQVLKFLKYTKDKKLYFVPERATTPDKNPVMLAIKYNKPKIFLYAYNNRESMPWKMYWKQISGDYNTMQQFLTDVAAISDQSIQVSSQELKDFVKKTLNDVIEYNDLKLKFYKFNELGDAGSIQDFRAVINKRPDLFIDYYNKVDTNDDFYIDENIYIVLTLNNLILTAIAENNLEENKKFFAYLLKDHPEYFKWLFKQLLFKTKDNMSSAKQAWAFLKDNFDTVNLALSEPELSNKIIETLMLEHVTRVPGAVISSDDAEFLKKLYIGFSATKEFRENPNITGLEYRYLISPAADEKNVISILTKYENGLFDLFKKPEEPNDEQDNPIMLAIKFNKPEIFLHAYENKDSLPWNVFWRQISGDYMSMQSFLDHVTTKMLDAGQMVVRRVNNISETNGSEMHAFVKNKLEENNRAKYKEKIEKFYMNFNANSKSNLDDLADCMRFYPDILADYFVSYEANEFMIDGRRYNKNLVGGAMEKILKDGNKELLENFYAYVFKQNIDYFQGLLFGTDESSVWSQRAWGYAQDHIGVVVKAIPSYTDIIVERMKYTGAKLKASSIVPYIDNMQTMMKLLGCIDNPSTSDDEIDPEENPLIIAAQKNKLAFVVEAFKLKDTPPWNLYWAAVGETNNTVMSYLLRQPLGGNKIDQKLLSDMLGFISNNPQCVKYVDYSLIENVVAHIRSLRGSSRADIVTNNLSNLLILLIPNLKEPKYFVKYFPENISNSTGLSLKNWFMWNLAVQQNGPKIYTGEESANDTVFADKVKKLMNSSAGVLSAELTKRNLSYEQAKVSLRYLFLRDYLEQEPDKSQPEHQQWVNLVLACGFDPQTIVNTLTKLSFQEYEEFIKNSKNTTKSEVIAGVMTGSGVGGESERLRELLNAKNPGASLSWQYRVKYSWSCFDPYRATHKNFDQFAVEQFVVFSMLRTTENLDELIAPLSTLPDLLKLMGRANGHERKQVEEANIDGVFNIALAKMRLKEYLSQEQKNMQSSMANAAAESWMANRGIGSCPTGIYSRFGKGVLNYDHQYSFVKDGSRPDIIKDIIYELFKSFVDKKLLQILIKEFKENIKKSDLNKSFKDGLDRRLSKITSLDDFKELVSKIKIESNETQLKVIGALLPNIDNHRIVGLLNALFTVSNEEWAELFVGSKSVKTFTAVVYATDERAKIADLDSDMNRMSIMSEFKDFVTNDMVIAKLKDLRENTELSAADKKYINFYVKIAGGDRGDKPGQKGLTSLGARYIAKVLELTKILAPVVVASKNAQYANLKSKIESILNKNVMQSAVPVATSRDMVVIETPAKKRLALLSRFFSFRKSKPIAMTTAKPKLPAAPSIETTISKPQIVAITPGDIGAVRSILNKLIYADYWDEPANKDKLNGMLKSVVAEELPDDMKVTPLHVLNYLYLNPSDHAALKNAQHSKNDSQADEKVTLTEFCILMNSGEVNIDTIEDKVNLEFIKKICNAKEDLENLQKSVNDSTVDPLAVVKYLSGRLEQLTKKPVAQINNMTKLIDAINQYFSPPEEIKEEAVEIQKNTSHEAPVAVVTTILSFSEDKPISPPLKNVEIASLEEGEVAPPPPPRKNAPPPPPKKPELYGGLSVKERMKVFEKQKQPEQKQLPKKPPPSTTPGPRKNSI